MSRPVSWHAPRIASLNKWGISRPCIKIFDASVKKSVCVKTPSHLLLYRKHWRSVAWLVLVPHSAQHEAACDSLRGHVIVQNRVCRVCVSSGVRLESSPGVSGPDNDRTIFPTSLCGPKISGPENDQIVWSLSGPRWSLSGPEISGPENDQMVWSLSVPGGHCLVLKFQDQTTTK